MIRVCKENHIHVMSRYNTPCIRVKPGTTMTMEVWDALEGRSLEYYQNKTPYENYVSQTNPATGPVYVEGALPGDVLEVAIGKIKLWDHGYIVLEKYLLNGPENLENVHLKLDITDDSLVYKGIKLPLEPMIGVIGTAPLKEKRVHDPGAHGGNMDAKIVTTGTRVLLPVYTEGALLAVGDVHAVMGDGEVFFQGVEIGADIELTINLIKGLRLKRPMMITTDKIACISSHRSIMTAEEQVIKDMGYYLTEVLGLSTEDACALMAFYGNLCFCQVVNPLKTVRIEIQQSHVDAFMRGINTI